MGNAYDNASLIVTPNAYKASKIYALKPTDGSGDLAFSRAGSKMVRNSAGLWETIGTNIPPLHYPVGGGCPSWLFEAEATNIVPDSLVLTAESSTISTSSVQSPLSGVFYEKITSTAATTFIGCRTGNVTIGSNANYTYSVFLKYDNQQFVQVLFNGSSSTDYVNIDLINGTIVGGTYISATIISEANGFRVTITTNAVASTVPVYVSMIDSSSAIRAANFTGDGVKSFYAIQLQVELGSTASSPIITAGSSVTRLRDVPQTFTSINGLTNFSVFFDITPTLLNNTMLFGSYSSGGTNSYLYYTSANSFLKRKDGTEINIGAHGMTLGTRYKIGYVVSGTTIKYFRNGALIFTSTIDGTLFDLASIWSSKDGGGSILPISGICKDSILYQTALSDSEAIELTTL